MVTHQVPQKGTPNEYPQGFHGEKRKMLYGYPILSGAMLCKTGHFTSSLTFPILIKLLVYTYQ